jgi:propionyl-CoA carboxylase alpha chain
VAGRLLAGANAADPTDDPWSGGWRLNSGQRVRLEAEGATRSVTLDDATPAFETVAVDGVAHVDVAGRSVAFRLAAAPDVDRAGAAARLGPGSGVAGGPATLIAPMPGAVLTVHVRIGSQVQAGDPVVTLEAMKMEHVVVAPVDGRLTELRVQPADQVTRGQELGLIEP